MRHTAGKNRMMADEQCVSPDRKITSFSFRSVRFLGSAHLNALSSVTPATACHGLLEVYLLNRIARCRLFCHWGIFCDWPAPGCIFISCDWTREGYLWLSGNTRGCCFREWPTVQLQSLHEFLRKLWFYPSYQQSTASPGKWWSWACCADGEEAAEESRQSLSRSSELLYHASSTWVQHCRAVDGKKTQDQGTDTTNSTCSWQEGHEQVLGNWCSPETAAKDKLWSAS